MLFLQCYSKLNCCVLFVQKEKIYEKLKAVMLTRKKRIGIDSSPKTSASKNIHLLTKETMQDTVNLLSTPTRRNRFMLGTNHSNTNDDSPILSQEPINITWKWNNEGTPIRPTNKSSKLRRSITNSSPQLQHLQQRLAAKRNTSDNQQNGIAVASTSNVSPKLLCEPETHSPKGLYKFQEEMRKIHFDTESDTSCDNLNDKSVTVTEDTGYPIQAQRSASPDHDTNARCDDSLDVHMEFNEHENVMGMEIANGLTKPSSQNSKHCIDDELADDLLNDSDFDQILLTCQIPAQKGVAAVAATDAVSVTVTNQSTVVTNQTSVKKASSAPEIKTSNSSNNSNSSGSNWNLIDDDCYDDLLKDVDVDIPSDSLNTSAKFTRHKSMPQQPQTPSNSNKKVFMVQQSIHSSNNFNRKSFTRHESMPITNSSIHRPPATNYNSRQSSTLSSSQARKCTSEEIAEKRRQAMERLKNRKQIKINT